VERLLEVRGEGIGILVAHVVETLEMNGYATT
jgi:hypothetical protein